MDSQARGDVDSQARGGGPNMTYVSHNIRMERSISLEP